MQLIQPIEFLWDGEVMRPRLPKLADKHYVIGETYRLEPSQERSPASHGHYFASLSDAWQNLPERLALEFPTSEHLRKRGLIATGFRDERSIVCASKAEALRLAMFIAPIDSFSAVSVSGAVVVHWTAKSQSLKAMGKADFQKSKDAVLDWAWALAGVDPETAAQHAGNAA